MPYAHITGWGISVPEPVLTNDDIAKMVDTNDEWIRDRTGIRERHIAREDQFPSTLGVEACIKALEVANLAPTEIDLIICTSSSPEYIFPATACLIQHGGTSDPKRFDKECSRSWHGNTFAFCELEG
jgi:3-oxoacyl-[acyl-carrier-protein] synthase-3